ncbi:MAG: hypothetical protein QF483_02190 [Gammaproteobacteria bacterium]|jgi:hypothetical protein|nr:hypothetical protein [Gammaproteobacteria bacterium]
MEIIWRIVPTDRGNRADNELAMVAQNSRYCNAVTIVRHSLSLWKLKAWQPFSEAQGGIHA